MGYKIFTDSSADLPLEIINKYNISVVPLSVNFKDEEFLEISAEEFYSKLEVAEELPTTSQVPPSRFMSAFKEELDKGNKVICVTIASSASGTYQSATLAKSELDSDDIYLVDSNTLSFGTGYIVVNLARNLEAGLSIERSVEKALELADNKIGVLFCVDTLKYLRKGGRITATKAIVAEALNIKPILNVIDGITTPIGKIRGKKKLISYYLNQLKSDFDIERNDYICIGHSLDLKSAKQLEEAIKNELGFTGQIIISEIGPIIGTHSGPGVLAVYYIKK